MKFLFYSKILILELSLIWLNFIKSLTMVLNNSESIMFQRWFPLMISTNLALMNMFFKSIADFVQFKSSLVP